MLLFNMLSAENHCCSRHIFFVFFITTFKVSCETPSILAKSFPGASLRASVTVNFGHACSKCTWLYSTIFLLCHVRNKLLDLTWQEKHIILPCTTECHISSLSQCYMCMYMVKAADYFLSVPRCPALRWIVPPSETLRHPNLNLPSSVHLCFTTPRQTGIVVSLAVHEVNYVLFSESACSYVHVCM